MTDRLALGLTLQDDDILQRRLGSHGERLSVRIPDAELWIEVGCGKPAIVHRQAPKSRSVDLAAALTEQPGLVAYIRAPARLARLARRAGQLLRPVVSIDKLPTREDIAALAPWFPLIEPHAYWLSAWSMQLIDSERPLLLASLRDGAPDLPARARRSWRLVLLQGHMTLLAANPAARHWLSEMARTFTWQRWTPTFPLLRERSLYVSGIAGRAAAAFGPDVAEPYLRNLRGKGSAMTPFDALFGLTAIALDNASARDAIVRELAAESDRLSAAGPTYLRNAYASALNVLREPHAAVERVRARLGAGREKGLATPIALRSDAGAHLASGEYLALSALPLMLQSSIGEFFPQSSRQQSRNWLSDRDVIGLLRTGWDAERARPSAPVH
jgi:hypothetical protein